MVQARDDVIPAAVIGHHRDAQPFFDAGKCLIVEEQPIGIKDVRREKEQVSAIPPGQR